MHRLGQQHRDDVLRLDLVAGLRLLVVDTHTARLGSGLHLVARHSGEVRLEVDVQPHGRLAAIHHKAVVLIQFLFLLFYLEGFVVHRFSVL